MSCLLDPIPIQLLKNVLSFVGTSILAQINLSLNSGYVPQVSKVAVIKPLLKKPSLDPFSIQLNHRQLDLDLSNLSPIAYESIVARMELTWMNENIHRLIS